MVSPAWNKKRDYILRSPTSDKQHGWCCPHSLKPSGQTREASLSPPTEGKKTSEGKRSNSPEHSNPDWSDSKILCPHHAHLPPPTPLPLSLLPFIQIPPTLRALPGHPTLSHPDSPSVNAISSALNTFPCSHTPLTLLTPSHPLGICLGVPSPGKSSLDWLGQEPPLGAPSQFPPSQP